MDIKTAMQLVDNSNNGVNYEVKIPSLDKTVLLKRMTNGMKKSLAKFAMIDDKEDYIKFQFAQLGLIKSLDFNDSIDLDLLTDIDFVALISQIMANNILEDLVLNIKCNKCENQFKHIVDFDAILVKCYEYVTSDFVFEKTVDDIAYAFALGQPKIVEKLTLDSLSLSKDYTNKDKLSILPYLFIHKVFINEEEVEIDTADVDSTLAAKVEVLDVIPQAVFTGENALNDQIAKYFPNYFSNVRALIDVEPCSECGATMEGVVTTDNFFIL